MGIIQNYKHNVGFHCESGSVRNLLKHEGLDATEAMIFGIGSGVTFAHLAMAKAVGGFPVNAIRLPMGAIIKNVQKFCKIKFFTKRYKTTEEAMKKADEMIASGKPVAICVDMFYMKYLPAYMHVHAPFHFIVLVGKENGKYYISDPYYSNIGELDEMDLKAAWETNALFSKDNLVAYVDSIPQEIDWKKAIIGGIKRGCRLMNIPEPVSTIAHFFGVQGLITFAKTIPTWPKKYSGLALREGMLFTPTILEEQGTGGGAFRLLYGAFLEEAADYLKSEPLKEISVLMIENGKQWREASRFLISLGKQVPAKSDEYKKWYDANIKEFTEQLKVAESKFMDRAYAERDIFKKLTKIAKTL